MIIISCGAKKLLGVHRARDLYVGSYFRAALNWATSVAPDNEIRILSARYGLIKLHDMVPSYELRLGQPAAINAATLKQSLEAKGLNATVPVIAVAGVDYVKLLKQVFNNVSAPFGKGGYFAKTGLGYQIKHLKEWQGQIP